MSKIQKILTGFSSALLVAFSFVVSINSVVIPAHAARCYDETRQIINGKPSDFNPILMRAEACDYANLSQLGFNMTGIPNPLPAGNSPCYVWRSISGGVDDVAEVVDCNSDMIKQADNAQRGTVEPTDASDLEEATSNTVLGSNVPDDKDDCSDPSSNLNEDNCGIIKLLNIVFNFVSGGVILAVIGNIIFAGIRYSTAQGNPSTSGAAKNRIRTAVMALLMYFLLYGFLQWLIPGGIF